MAEPSLYDLTKIAFNEVLSLQGTDITFAGSTKKCMAHYIINKLPWQAVGFLADEDVKVEMVDDDWNEWISYGVIERADATIILDWLVFTVVEVRSISTDPVVTIQLTIDK